ncbi:tripartite tricarboxylate transporter TctB family protein [Stutzerimonas azotifigens]|uniref:tripartite tricarboxylate transporter TctB family protein n=1 Tax=Stutzerimonas azotifigens TaxID=291995 RepID=UPI000405D63B|nr:tripartite tricarboxylate transporter TctB family protein [Stutzerimonas azotifigens]
MIGKLNADRCFGLLFVVVGLALALYGWNLPTANRLGDVGSGFLPTILGAMIALLGAVLVIAPRSEECLAIGKGRLGTALGFIAAGVAHAALFVWFGFSFPTFAFLAVTMFMLSDHSLRALALSLVVAALFTGLLGWLLYGVLRVPLAHVWFFG